MNMQLLLSTFGGFPRLSRLCSDLIKREPSVLEKLKKLDNLGLDTSKFLFDEVLKEYVSDMRGMVLWFNSFRKSREWLENRDLHDPYTLGLEYLKRIHKLAVTGDSIPIGLLSMVT